MYIDFHCDTASLIYAESKQLKKNTYHIDLQKTKKEYLAQWFAFFLNLKDIKIDVFNYFSIMYDYFMHQLRINNLKPISSYKEYKNNKGLSVFLSIEEGEVVKDGLHVVDKLQSMGITLMTLTWNYKNSLGSPHSINEGLTEYGKSVVDYLNNNKILLDVSHLSDLGIDDALALTKKPIIASHSNARAVKNHSRNLSDEHIKKIALTGGTIGINFYNAFLSDSYISKVNDIVYMAKYISNLAGVEGVVFGSDFDGIDCPLEITDSSKITILKNALYEEFGSDIADKFLYKNAERLIKENF
ncbi:MAG: hypothetical protein BEN19_02210 [Epulopiscium sp. Nuni2H_MBin003]|nr:MAG: hypothetical protein BEN19_02210 [Epulopiscium sp. Nuni2H_MBin003]